MSAILCSAQPYPKGIRLRAEETSIEIVSESLSGKSSYKFDLVVHTHFSAFSCEILCKERFLNAR